MKNILSVFLVLSVCAPLLAAPPRRSAEPQYDRHAALVYSPYRYRHNMKHFLRAWSEDSQTGAGEVAKLICGYRDCEVVMYVERGCIASAEGMAQIGGSYHFRNGWGSAKYSRGATESVAAAKQRTKNAAVLAAKTGCEGKSAGMRCQPSPAFCTWDVDLTPADDHDVAQWIADFGGEGSPEIANMRYLVGLYNYIHWVDQGLTFDAASCIGGRKWSRVRRMAQECNLSLGDLDTIKGG